MQDECDSGVSNNSIPEKCTFNSREETAKMQARKKVRTALVVRFLIETLLAAASVFFFVDEDVHY